MDEREYKKWRRISGKLFKRLGGRRQDFDDCYHDILVRELCEPGLHLKYVDKKIIDYLRENYGRFGKKFDLQKYNFLSALRGSAPLGRLENGKWRFIEVDDLFKLPSNHSTVEEFEDMMEFESLLKKVKSSRTRGMLAKYFITGLKQKEIGKIYNITESRVCQLIKEFSKSLRSDDMETLPQSTAHMPQAVPAYKVDYLKRQYKLTTRQAEVLAWLNYGASNKDIASKLDVTEKSVKFHFTSVFKKMGVTSRTQAIVKMINEAIPK
jgi:DNA-binding CsgD family transcriptional regulator/DNA-directed RNA polymerase specialized sigma24 family protein